MDNRAASDSVMQEALIESVIGRMFFIRPGIIKKWNAEKNLVDAQIGIKIKSSNIDGSVKYEDLPVIPNVPVATFYSPAAGLGFTSPIRVGDPCTLLFSDRMINIFMKDGKICVPEENGQNNQTTNPRQHEIEDALCFPGIILQNSCFKDWNNDAVEIRDIERKVYTSVSKEGIESTDGEAKATITEGAITCNGPQGVTNTDGNATIEIKDGLIRIDAPNGISIDSPNFKIEEGGDGDVSGTFNGQNLTTDSGFNANSHRHSGVETGGGNTGPFV